MKRDASPKSSSCGEWLIEPLLHQAQALTCGSSFTKTHTAGTVAAVTKTVTYGSVTNIPGETAKCWITRNLGATQPPNSVSDNTEAAAGWYWQFNRKQGYQYDGTTRTPNTTWITSISENSDWESASDPCSVLLGIAWRIPTRTEWTNVDAAGNWIEWNGPFSSGLQMHAAGNLNNLTGLLALRGSDGIYLSSTQNSLTSCFLLGFDGGGSNMSSGSKAAGFSMRCIRE
jgi:hypothetical protein